jgi:hypothetical protein
MLAVKHRHKPFHMIGKSNMPDFKLDAWRYFPINSMAIEVGLDNLSS